MKIQFTLLTSFCFFLQIIVNAQPGSGNDLDLNGSSQYVDCGTINTSGNSITIQGWIKVQAFKTAFPYISSFAGTEQTGNQATVRIGDATIANNKVQFILYIGGTHYKLHSQQGLTTNKWYHIAATYDNAQMKLYINGVLDTARNQTGSFVSNSTFELGRNYGNARILNGELDDISVFSTALSQTTIREWMCKNITSSHPDYPALIAHWKLNESSGTTAYDSSPNGNDGSITGSPTKKYSGAPIGDASKYVYGSNFNIGLSHPDGDSLNIESTSGSFSGVHLYRVDSFPNETNAPAPLQYLDSSRYWGIFPIINANYDIDYYYNGNPAVGNDECVLAFAYRNDNADDDWDAQAPDSVNYNAMSLSFSNSNRREIIMAISNNGPHSFGYDIASPLCNGDANGEATAIVTGGLAPFFYDWSTGATSATATGLSAGAYYITVTDDNDCESEDSVVVTEPSPVGASGAVINTACTDTNTGLITVTAVGGVGGYTYSWDDPNSTTTATATGLYAGTYNVTVTDSNGCSETFEYTVSATGPDPEPALGNDTTLCDGVVHGLTASGNGGPFTNYSWSDGSSGTILVISQAGIYAVTVQNSQGCSGSDVINISYTAPIQVQLGNKNQSGIGSKTLDAGANFVSYLWSTGATTQTITVTTTATYWVETTDSNHCTSRDTVNVKITPAGLRTLNSPEVLIFPNPTRDKVWVQTESTGEKNDYELISVDGRVMHSNSFANEMELDLTNISAGFYILQIEFGDSRTGSYLIQKQ
ncbi:MAG: T9SS type A sorting domain-containing protein [Flavobacteriales bacterium]|jgi:hypothetical protein|nr:T9SS type A sorting domain-containing protein [Flavobacteriales bacterium]MBT3962812.1 T9SS type A sorting domain-containing protein [Flavobacteriales bacterium]MBT4704640.1 T9SS type A sorting domain-containing protein [Flavobacteriales bacterium]MBT4931777.1 T9SS type A sorting domain-containing protein [Flavobacteriales bacterium]MBT5133743.1 T9SS type A sorting domain-containing protein [Flavobacteriales bacterium]